MTAPNSLRLPDDEIVRIYREARPGTHAQSVKTLAHVCGASERAIVSILERRSADLGMAPRPKWSGHTYGFITPAARSISIDDVMRTRLMKLKHYMENIQKEFDAMERLLEAMEDGLQDNIYANGSSKRIAKG